MTLHFVDRLFSFFLCVTQPNIYLGGNANDGDWNTGSSVISGKYWLKYLRVHTGALNATQVATNAALDLATVTGDENPAVMFRTGNTVLGTQVNTGSGYTIAQTALVDLRAAD